MRRSTHTFTAILVVLALTVAVLTAVAVLTVPDAGTTRYAANDSHSALAQLRESLQAVGITQPTGTIQNLIIRHDGRPLSFQAATYWTADDVASRRDEYLGAGALLVLTLLISAFALEYRSRSRRVPTSSRSSQTRGSSSAATDR
jgi:hypothetical protein